MHISFDNALYPLISNKNMDDPNTWLENLNENSLNSVTRKGCITISNIDYN